MKHQNATILEAMSTLRAEKPSRMSNQIFAGILMVLFFILLLLALSTGVSVYKRVADVQIATGDERLGVQLIANNVRSQDGVDTVRIGEGPEGDALVLVENLESGSYETRIYLYNGAVMQEYTIAGQPYDPENKAVKMIDSSQFSFTLDGQLLFITTDQGNATVMLRCAQGGGV